MSSVSEPSTEVSANNEQVEPVSKQPEAEKQPEKDSGKEAEKEAGKQPEEETDKESEESEEETEWPCSVCTFLNPLASRMCSMCGNRRPLKYSQRGNPIRAQVVSPAEGEEEKWRDELKVEDEIDGLLITNLGGFYVKGVITEVKEDEQIQVTFADFNHSEWVSRKDKRRVLKVGTMSPRTEPILRQFMGLSSKIEEKKREDPMSAEEKKWRENLKIGDEVDALDQQGIWFIATVLQEKMVDGKKEFYLNFTEWTDAKWNIWVKQDSNNIRPPYSKSKPRGEIYDPLNDYMGRMPDYSKVDTALTASSINHYPEPAHITQGRFVKCGMPKDNSCMFYSLSYVCESKPPKATKWVLTQRLRCAKHILDNAEDFPDYVLGVEPAAYADELKRLQSWGGAIELIVMSQIYQTQIVAIDIKSCVVYKFPDSDDHKYKTRVFIAYRGNHYDALAFLPDGSNTLQEKFSINDEKAANLAIKHCELLHMAVSKTGYIHADNLDWKGLGDLQSCILPPSLCRQKSEQSEFSIDVSPLAMPIKRSQSLPTPKRYQASEKAAEETHEKAVEKTAE